MKFYAVLCSGGSNLPVMFVPPEEDEQKDHEAALAALSTFIEKYAPAGNDKSLTDMFTSEEISDIVASHAGYYFELQELNELLRSMGYKTDYQEGKFLWQLHKSD